MIWIPNLTARRLALSFGLSLLSQIPGSTQFRPVLSEREAGECIGDWDPGAEGALLVLESRDAAFTVGDNIVLRVGLANRSEANIVSGVSSEWGDYELNAIGDDDRALPLTPSAERHVEGARRGTTRSFQVTLPSGEGRYLDDISLSKWFDLSRAGRYRVSASKHVWTYDLHPGWGTVRSNDLVITIRPRGETHL